MLVKEHNARFAIALSPTHTEFKDRWTKPKRGVYYGKVGEEEGFTVMFSSAESEANWVARAQEKFQDEDRVCEPWEKG